MVVCGYEVCTKAIRPTASTSRSHYSEHTPRSALWPANPRPPRRAFTTQIKPATETSLLRDEPLRGTRIGCRRRALVQFGAVFFHGRLATSGFLSRSKTFPRCLRKVLERPRKKGPGELNFSKKVATPANHFTEFIQNQAHDSRSCRNHSKDHEACAHVFLVTMNKRFGSHTKRKGPESRPPCRGCPSASLKEQCVGSSSNKQHLECTRKSSRKPCLRNGDQFLSRDQWDSSASDLAMNCAILAPISHGVAHDLCLCLVHRPSRSAPRRRKVYVGLAVRVCIDALAHTSGSRSRGAWSKASAIPPSSTSINSPARFIPIIRLSPQIDNNAVSCKRGVTFSHVVSWAVEKAFRPLKTGLLTSCSKNLSSEGTSPLFRMCRTAPHGPLLCSWCPRCKKCRCTSKSPRLLSPQ